MSVYLPDQPEGEDPPDVPEDLAPLSDINVAVLLMLLITSQSEDDGCAIWLDEIEHDLWEVAGGGDAYGHGCDAATIALLSRFRERLGGQWVAYLAAFGKDEGTEPGVYLLTAEEWAPRHAAQRERRAKLIAHYEANPVVVTSPSLQRLIDAGKS